MTTRSRRLSVAVLLALAVMAIDIVSGSEIRVYPFYFVPIVIASTALERLPALAFATLCAGLWLLSKWLDGTQFAGAWTWIWNTMSQEVAFVFVAMIVARLRASLAKQAETAKALGTQNVALAEKGLELEKLNDALSEAMRSLEDVERIARHDLKTPLSSIAATPALLRAGRVVAPEEERLLGMIEAAAKRALAMVNLSLSLRQMETGQYAFKPASVDLTRIVGVVIDDLAVHAASKAVVIQVGGGADVHCVRGEDMLCYSLVANLLKNAIEAAPDGSAVRVEFSDDGVRVRLEIANQGAIPAAIRERFFAKYATHGKTGGAGLGAYSALLMARAQGGELTVTSSPEAGTRLSLVLDGAPPPLVELAPDTSSQHDLDDDSQNRIGPQRVLIADDDQYNRLVLERMLPKPAVTVETVANGRMAVEAVMRERPDVIFMDIEMPVMGGVEALNQIREFQSRTHQVPSFIVAYSANDDEKSRAGYLESGFDRYLSKPSQRGDVLALLDSAGANGSRDPTRFEIVAVDQDLMPEIPGFLQTRRALIEDLRHALSEGNRPVVCQIAHKLSGSFAVFGFRHASSICKEIERDGESADLTLLNERVLRLTRHLDSLRMESRDTS